MPLNGHINRHCAATARRAPWLLALRAFRRVASVACSFHPRPLVGAVEAGKPSLAPRCHSRRGRDRSPRPGESSRDFFRHARARLRRMPVTGFALPPEGHHSGGFPRLRSPWRSRPLPAPHVVALDLMAGQGVRIESGHFTPSPREASGPDSESARTPFVLVPNFSEGRARVRPKNSEGSRKRTNQRKLGLPGQEIPSTQIGGGGVRLRCHRPVLNPRVALTAISRRSL